MVRVRAPISTTWPWASWRITTRLASHARRRDVSAETSRRLACDASRVVMRHDAQGHVVEIGARTRTIPPALRRALDHRDRGCRFPGCGVRFGQGHHIRHWAQDGPTTLSNLAMLCRRHHRAVHEEGYQVDRQRDGELSTLTRNYGDVSTGHAAAAKRCLAASLARSAARSWRVKVHWNGVAARS